MDVNISYFPRMEVPSTTTRLFLALPMMIRVFVRLVARYTAGNAVSTEEHTFVVMVSDMP